MEQARFLISILSLMWFLSSISLDVCLWCYDAWQVLPLQGAKHEEGAFARLAVVWEQRDRVRLVFHAQLRRQGLARRRAPAQGETQRGVRGETRRVGVDPIPSRGETRRRYATLKSASPAPTNSTTLQMGIL